MIFQSVNCATDFNDQSQSSKGTPSAAQPFVKCWHQPRCQNRSRKVIFKASVFKMLCLALKRKKNNCMFGRQNQVPMRAMQMLCCWTHSGELHNPLLKKRHFKEVWCCTASQTDAAFDFKLKKSNKGESIYLKSIQIAPIHLQIISQTITPTEK